MTAPDPLHAEQMFARKVAFVTGAAGGIGQATARAFAAAGAAVAVADLNQAGARRRRGPDPSRREAPPQRSASTSPTATR